MANTLKFGNGQWATGNGTALAYNDENANFKPLPFDFTRASSGTVVNQSGLIETVGSGIPRIDFLGNTKGALLLEPSRSNVILQSQDITTNWSQGNTPTLTSNIAVAPDGTMTADGIQSESDGAFRTVRQLSISISANSTVTNSYFVKKETSEINYGGFGFVFSGGTTKVVYGIVNSVNGTVTYDTNLTPTTKVEDYGSYWRISSTVTDTGSNTSLGIYYYGTLSINGTSLNTGVGSVRTIWGMQLELNSSYATSYIPTSGSAVTRVADVCSQTVSSNIITQSEGTLYWSGDLNNLANYSNLISLSGGSGSWIYLLSYVAGLSFEIKNNSSTSLSFNPSGYTEGSYKIAISYSGSECVIYINGVLAHTDSSVVIPSFSTLNIGQWTGYGEAKNTKEVKLYNTRLSNSELQALTQV